MKSKFKFGIVVFVVSLFVASCSEVNDLTESKVQSETETQSKRLGMTETSQL